MNSVSAKAVHPVQTPAGIGVGRSSFSQNMDLELPNLPGAHELKTGILMPIREDLNRLALNLQIRGQAGSI